jgi:hypothetical protein
MQQTFRGFGSVGSLVWFVALVKGALVIMIGPYSKAGLLVTAVGSVDGGRTSVVKQNNKSVLSGTVLSAGGGNHVTDIASSGTSIQGPRRFKVETTSSLHKRILVRFFHYLRQHSPGWYDVPWVTVLQGSFDLENKQVQQEYNMRGDRIIHRLILFYTATAMLIFRAGILTQALNADF